MSGKRFVFENVCLPNSPLHGIVPENEALLCLCYEFLYFNHLYIFTFKKTI